MRVEIDIDKIRRNIKKAKTMTSVAISLMFKDFYEDIFYKIGDTGCKVFSKHITGSVCYSLYNATNEHEGCFVTTYTDFLHNYTVNKIRQFYVPINSHDDREGLCLNDAKELCERIKNLDASLKVYGVVTSGCLNDKHPSCNELEEIWSAVGTFVESLSVGGSFWLSHKLPDFVSEIRIGEYMLFGTIPYDSQESLLGECAISIRTNVVGVYPERNQIIVDCGYSMADVKNCTLKAGGLKYVDSSSEYSIFETSGRSFYVGEEIEIRPNYKSLVTLKNAERNYIQKR